MSLEVVPNTVQFESTELASQVELTLNNKSNNDVKYRFRLQSKSTSITNPKGTVKGGGAKTVLVDYDPTLNTTRGVLLSMQIKYSEITSPDKEQTILIPIQFKAEQDMEDGMFKTPMSSKRREQMDPWWKKMK